MLSAVTGRCENSGNRQECSVTNTDTQSRGVQKGDSTPSVPPSTTARSGTPGGGVVLCGWLWR